MASPLPAAVAVASFSPATGCWNWLLRACRTQRWDRHFRPALWLKRAGAGQLVELKGTRELPAASNPSFYWEAWSWECDNKLVYGALTVGRLQGPYCSRGPPPLPASQQKPANQRARQPTRAQKTRRRVRKSAQQQPASHQPRPVTRAPLSKGWASSKLWPRTSRQGQRSGRSE